MTDMTSKIEAAKEKISSLKSQIEQVQKSKTNQTMEQALQAVLAAAAAAPPALESDSTGDGGGGGGGDTITRSAADKARPATLRTPPAVKVRRTLKGHFGKITAIHWDGTSTQVVSGGQDGNLLIWNAVTANKAQAIPLKSAYVMAVGMEQSRGNLVACGGLDNMCTVYPVSFGNHPDISHAMELASHDGFLSCCRFTSEQEIITSSGDSTCIQWDISAGKPISTFAEHAVDCMYLSLKPNDKHLFASCSVDQTVKIWDTRVGGSGASPKKSVQSFGGHHTGDINCVEFMPCNGNAFATCSQDSTVRLFDLRAYNQVNKFSVTPTTAATMAAMAAAAAEGGGGGGDVEGVGGMEGGGSDGGEGGGGNGNGGCKPTDASLNKAPAVVPASHGEGDDDAESGDDGMGGGGGGHGEGGGDNQANKAAARAAAMEDFEEEVGYDAFTSLAFSGSGRLIFCGHADGSVYAFDVLSSDSSENAAVFVLQGAHERNVSSIGVSPSGNALATASWDGSLKIWA